MSPEDVRILFPTDLEFFEGLSREFLMKLEKFWSNFNNDSSELSPCLITLGHSLRTFANWASKINSADRKRKKLEAKNSRLRRKFTIFVFNQYLLF